MRPLPLKLPDIATPSTRRSIYLPRCTPFLTENVNIYLQDKPYHKLKSDLIPYANYLHEIKELFSKRLKEIIT
ncbi:hypothetical protein DQY65_13735 [Salmonella enterica subsp. enterica serovar Chester]|uniref:Uncharacterized protein n=1 Tax=Salmonella enterica subsp. enterica serovar Chester TaxID=149386 RepID=A0A5I0R9T5_SALET|nr:hypothetical protein [Salmonella enterica subsp. enterica serovar Chester]EAO9476728.1 hypothetical protein [Salmonella enterica]ECC3215536.1 hypothetical protein [Salmonella enterica subsp. enterica]ECO2987423.1 hypothetical protein [Salmonella enterica subsp. enterica serovar Salford]ECU8441980.1 hypothetical protein [Salmonella enterica subsp. enterica serovar Sandiego]EGZ4505151.1 hypothetical protein [Salmonella enterica subsp. enterica serovar Javiana]